MPKYAFSHLEGNFLLPTGHPSMGGASQQGWYFPARMVLLPAREDEDLPEMIFFFHNSTKKIFPDLFVNVFGEISQRSLQKHTFYGGGN